MFSNKNNRQTHRRRRWAAALAFALVLALGLAAVASALTAGNVDGVWGSPTPSNTSSFRWCYAPDNTSGSAGAPTACSTSSAGIQNPPDSTTTDENQWRYGTPSGFPNVDGNRSGYGFNGNNNVGSVAADVPFYLGRFTHYNNPITASNILTQIGLSITMDNLLCDDGSVPTQGGTQNFNYTFTHDETPNNPANNPGGVCPWGDSTGNGCDDKVTVSQQPSTTFTCPEGERTLQILGFIPGANCEQAYVPPVTNSFVTGERQTNPACLWARISDPSTPPLAVTLASFEAQWSGNQVVTTWDTVSEMSNLGFNLYRSESANQMGELITAQMIPSQSPGSLQGYSYSFVDSGVTPGVTYWYTLEDIETSGATSLHGPVSAVPQAPTAVTLASLAADTMPTSPALPALLALTLALAALVAGLTWRSRMRTR